MPEHRPSAKVADLVSLGILFGTGTPDPNVVILRLWFRVGDMIEELEIVHISLYVCIHANIVKNSHGSDLPDKSMRPSKIIYKSIAIC